MSDRPKTGDDKIVSLDQRRREDAARQKAELAAAAAARGKTNGAGRDLKQPFGWPMAGGAPSPGRAGRPGGAGALGNLVGSIVAMLVWGGLAVMVALAIWTSVKG